jgi:Leucine-rich repeat (LRR) protein
LEKQPEIASKLVAFSAKRTAPLLNQLMSTFEKQKTKTLKIKSVEELNKITLEKAAEVGTLNLRGVRLGSDFNQLPKFKNVWRLLLTKADITDSKLKIVLALPKLTILSLVMTEITDDGLKNLENTSLNRLFLRQTKITDSGLASLAKIPSLKRLDLRYTNVTDDGLKNIRELELESLLLSGQNISGKGLAYLDNRSKLKYLTLSGKNVTDESISALKGLESLSSLDLSYSQVGDKGISNLPELPNLKKLVLKGLQITPSKITALKERFPDLKIIF